MIFIITNKEDVHPTPVIELLSKLDVPVFRLNTEALLTDYEFCWYTTKRGTDFSVKCLLNGLEVKGSEITAVWERRPELPNALPYDSTPEINKHNKDEALGFLQFMRYYLKDIPSIGNIVFDRVASSKMLQFKLAKSVGLSIPDTCFSNRKADILHFSDSYENILMKPIESSSIWDDVNDREYVFYAQKVDSKSLTDVPEEAFSQTANFVQNYVDKAFELRITIVSNDVFACKIDSQVQSDSTGKIDWRQGYDYGLKLSAFDLPRAISNKCKNFLKKMKLNFGCFDFIVTPSGEYVFLECNPNGQWLWVELATGQKISESIASFFEYHEKLN